MRFIKIVHETLNFIIYFLHRIILFRSTCFKKRVLSYYRLIERADLIVHGTLIKTDDATYDVKINECLKGITTLHI